MYLTRNQAYCKVPWVRIPPSPPYGKRLEISALRRFFYVLNLANALGLRLGVRVLIEALCRLFEGQPNQISDIADPHFVHHSRLVNLNGPRTDAQLGRNFPVV